MAPPSGMAAQQRTFCKGPFPFSWRRRLRLNAVLPLEGLNDGHDDSDMLPSLWIRNMILVLGQLRQNSQAF